MTSTLSAMHGGLTVMCLVAALFFVRYWRLTKDTFFVWFACAFTTFAFNWALRATSYAELEHSTYVYGLRLLGFALILTAILIKNRSSDA